MQLRKTISLITEDIKNKRFPNEASVSQGIVLRLLSTLGWDIYDIGIVIPEYSIQGKRVDYALCNPRNKPIVFIEVKQIGHAEGFEKQLFEYAFHQGIPFAILTDGQEWSFYLPGEQGLYEERRVYKLDILERGVEESCKIFTKYLTYKKIVDGTAIESARNDYRDVSKQREISETIPLAWSKLINEKEELLLELLAEKVESLCGYKPELKTVEIFFEQLSLPNQILLPQSTNIQVEKRKTDQQFTSKLSQLYIEVGYEYKSKKYNCKTAREVMIDILKTFNREDNSFLEKFASLPSHGKKRRYVSKNKYELYPGRPDLAEQSSHIIQFAPGWWLGLNYNKSSIEKIIRMACEVHGVRFGSELTISL